MMENLLHIYYISHGPCRTQIVYWGVFNKVTFINGCLGFGGTKRHLGRALELIVGIWSTPPDLKGQGRGRQGISVSTSCLLPSLPASASYRLNPTGSQGQGIINVVHKAQPLGTQSKVKKYAEWLWGDHTGGVLYIYPTHFCCLCPAKLFLLL